MNCCWRQRIFPGNTKIASVVLLNKKTEISRFKLWTRRYSKHFFYGIQKGHEKPINVLYE